MKGFREKESAGYDPEALPGPDYQASAQPV